MGGSGRDARKSNEENEMIERSALRFYIALALDELIKEKPVWQVAAKYLFTLLNSDLIFFLDSKLPEEKWRH